MNTVLAIDLGSSQITAAVADMGVDRRITVRGLGRARSTGMKQGVVIDIDAVVEGLKRAVLEANKMAGTRCNQPLVSIGGAHLLGEDLSGQIALGHREVTDALLTQIMSQIQSRAETEGRLILSVIPRAFTLDQQSGIRNPQGMSGQVLEAHVHLITGSQHAVANIHKCLERAGLDASVLVPSALAVSQLVLADERELGVCVVDIGLGTTDLMVLSDGAPAWMQVLPFGGEWLTHDLAVALKTPVSDAEVLKIQYGYAHTRFAPVNQDVQVKKIADRPAVVISLQQLTAFLQPRVEEIAEMIGDRLRRSGRFEAAATGLVLSGGTAALPGISQVVESILQCPCRVLKGSHQDGLEGLLKDPANAVLAGLLAYGREQEIRPKPHWMGVQAGLLNRVRQWIHGNF